MNSAPPLASFEVPTYADDYMGVNARVEWVVVRNADNVQFEMLVHCHDVTDVEGLVAE